MLRHNFVLFIWTTLQELSEGDRLILKLSRDAGLPCMLGTVCLALSASVFPHPDLSAG